MKRLLLFVCLSAMMAASMGLKAQQVTIPLMPGWTWISYPSTDTVDFATAFGSFTPAVGDVIESQYGIAEYIDGVWYGDVQQFYPGYGYLYYSSRSMPVFLTFNVQQPAPSVVVTTSEPMMITAISAMGGGEVTVNDGTYIIVKGLCWAAHENPTTNDDFYEEAESGVGSFSLSMTGLNIGTTYYVRAYAVTPNGTIYGDQKTFTTRDGIPTLTTDGVVDITGVTATCGGNITDNGGLNVTARGVCWSTSPNPTVADSHTTNGSETGSFSSSITGLNISTTYYVRAYATTAAGTAYGDQKTFTTRDGIPTLTTADISNITGATATCGGNITDDGGLDIKARGVCWSTSPNPTLSDSHTSNGTGSGTFPSIITGLDASTTYYVRAYATTNADTAFGNEVCFTTRDDAPTGAINGLFTINSNGDQVYFSQGNLQYIGSAATPYWKFAGSQWDYLGDNGQVSANQNADRDLFGWGTSGYNHGAVCYQPWSTSSTNSNYCAYGMFTYNLNDSTGMADWGYNPISNGGNQENQWRTLTQPEWDYVFNTRNTTSGIRYAKAQVNEVNGVILLPDDWSNSTYSLSNINSSGANFSSNTLTISQWSTLEQAGAVFLPAAGRRSNGIIQSLGSGGYYWSSSLYTNRMPLSVIFANGNLSTGYTDSYWLRWGGQSVRLVRVSEN